MTSVAVNLGTSGYRLPRRRHHWCEPSRSLKLRHVSQTDDGYLLIVPYDTSGRICGPVSNKRRGRIAGN